MQFPERLCWPGGVEGLDLRPRDFLVGASSATTDPGSKFTTDSI